MPYIGNQPGTGVRSRFIYTATASQTTFSGADDNSKTLKYADSDYIDVYLNGVCLVPGTDYTASTKTSIVLTQAASVSDTLEVVAYDIATISDTVSKADGGTFEGDLGITNASPDLTLTNNTTEDTDGGRESTVTFKGLQSGGEESTLAEIRASHDATADDEKGDLIFKTNDGSDGASPTERLRIDSDGSIVPATLGTSNVKLGLNAGKAIASGGNYNTVIGEEAGAALSTGDVNTFVGYQSGDATTTSGNNVGVGYASLTTNILSSKNVAIGNNALKTHNLGSAGEGLNVAIGHGAGEEITTGTQNTIVGALAGDALTTGGLVAVGYLAGSAATTSIGNVLMGELSGTAITTGNNNTAVGSQALSSADTGADNTCVGHDAGRSVSQGIQNTFIGSNTGDATTNASDNVAVGFDALGANVGGQNNVAIGVRALRDATVSSGNIYNTAVGSNAGRGTTSGLNNVYIGGSAGINTSTNSYTTFVGTNAGYGTSGSELTGNFNTVVGYEAGFKLQGAARTNTFLGVYAGYFNGSTSTANGITTGTNNTCLGFAAYPSSATAADEITLGDGDVNNLRCNDTSISSLSDERDKTNIVDVPLGLNFINTLRPVSFDWNRRDGKRQGVKDFGFIAQELKTAQDATDYADHMRLVHTGTVLVPDTENSNATEDEDGMPIRDVSGTMQECLEADPMKTYPVLVKAVQELSTALDAALARIATLEAE